MEQKLNSLGAEAISKQMFEDTEIIKKLLNEYLKDSFKIKTVKAIPGGFRAKAFLISAEKNGERKNLFLKHTIPDLKNYHDNNVEKLASYLLSQQISKEMNLSPRVLGIFMAENGKIINIDSFTDITIIYQLQEFQEGQNYLDYLCSSESDENFLAENKAIAAKIAKNLAQIHTKKIDMAEKEKEILYKKSLRNAIINPELALSMIENNIKGSLFEGDFRREYIGEMLEVNAHFWKNFNRLSLLHGDFWPGNIALAEAEPFFFDYSRYMYGDPGSDVGHFYLSMVIFSIWRKDKRYFELGESFLDAYKKETTDDLITETSVLAFGPTGVVFILDKFFQGPDMAERKKFADYIMACLRSKKVIPAGEYFL